MIDETGKVKGVIFARNADGESKTYSTSVEELRKLLNAPKPNYSFVYSNQMDKDGQYLSDHSVGSAAAMAGIEASGWQLYKYAPKTAGIISGAYGLMCATEDLYKFKNSATDMDSLKNETRLFSDVAIAASSAAFLCNMLTRPASALICGLAFLTRQASALLPNRLQMESLHRNDGTADRPVQL